jgi:hypothetical protein
MAGSHFTSNVLSERSESKDQPPLSFLAKAVRRLVGLYAARVRSESPSLSNCANATSTPSISLPGDVSSIGSMADRKAVVEPAGRGER